MLWEFLHFPFSQSMRTLKFVWYCRNCNVSYVVYSIHAFSVASILLSHLSGLKFWLMIELLES